MSQNYPFTGNAQTFGNDFAVNEAYPGVLLGGTETGALYYEDREVAGTKYYNVQNATFNKVSQSWLPIDITKPAYAMALTPSGTTEFLTANAGVSPITAWTVVYAIDSNGNASFATTQTALAANANLSGIGVYNVKFYGAKGDGVTDDTTAIQGALNAAGTAGGGDVFLPFATYVVSATLVLPSNVRVRGESSTLKVANGANLNYVVTNVSLSNYATYSATTKSLTLPGVNHTYAVYDPSAASNYASINNGVSDIIIDGNGSQQGAGTGYGIAFNGVQSALISNVLLQNLYAPSGIGGTAVALRNCVFSKVDGVVSIGGGPCVLVDSASYNFTVSNCRAYNSNDTPFGVIGGGTTPYHGAWENCISDGCAIGAGFDLAGCILQSFSNCRAANAHHHGFDLHTNLSSPCAYIEISNCAAYKCGVGTGFSGFAVNPAIQVNLTGCKADECDSGLTIFSATPGDCSDGTFTGCSFINSNAGPGVNFNMSVGAGTRMTFSGCIMNDLRGVPTQTYGLVYAGTGDYLTLTGCTLSPNVSGGLNLTTAPQHGKYVANLGYNPLGASITQPTVGASPWTFVNNYAGVDATLFVSGGTVSSISVDGKATGLTAGSFRVPNNKSLTITYSVAPTVALIGD